MGKLRYPKITDEGVSLRSGGILKMACCDCGLVHRMAFVSQDRKSIGVAMERDNRATGARRRAKAVKERLSVVAHEALIRSGYMKVKRG